MSEAVLASSTPESGASDNSKMPVHHRYPGPGSFEDDVFDTRVFFGRSREITELADRVTSDRLVVLYGKSGLGKTSLLQAGLFPRLRQQRFLPVRIRPTDFGDDDIFDVITESVEKACSSRNYEFSPGEGQSLWEYFHTSLISGGGTFLVPILVLDQFEEVFKKKDAAFRDRLGKELGHMLIAIAPPGRRTVRENDTPSLPARPPDVRIMLSLREEYVGALDEFAQFFPGLLSSRVRLHPLSREAARGAIENPPNERDVSFASRPFKFAEGEVDKVLDYLVDKQDNVEPIELQIICQFIEREVIAIGDVKEIPPVFAPYPSKLEDVLGKFYLATVAACGGRLQTRRVRKLCEYGLVSDDGFRESVPERRIVKEYKIDNSTLETLVGARLLRREDRLSDMWYELTHDRIAGAVKASRPRTGAKIGAAAAILIVGFMAIWVPSYLQDRHAYQLIEKIESGSDAEIASALVELANKNIDLPMRQAVLASTSNALFLYHDRKVRELFSPEIGRYDFKGGQKRLKEADNLYPDSRTLNEFEFQLNAERDTSLITQFKQLNRRLETGGLLTETDLGILDIIRELDPNVQRIRQLEAEGELQIDKLLLALAIRLSQAASVAFTDGDFVYAQRLVDTGLAYVPDDPVLINLADRLSARQQRIAKIAGLEQQLRGVVLTTLDNAGAIVPAMRELDVLDSINPLLTSTRNLLEPVVSAGLAQLLDDDDVTGAYALLDVYAGAVTSDFVQTELDRIKRLGVDDVQEVRIAERAATIDQLISDYNSGAYVDETEPERLFREALALFTSAAGVDAAEKYRLRIGELYIGSAQDLRESDSLVAARAQLDRAALFIPDLPRLQDERELIGAAQERIERQQDDARETAAALAAENRLLGYRQNLQNDDDITQAVTGIGSYRDTYRELFMRHENALVRAFLSGVDRVAASPKGTTGARIRLAQGKDLFPDNEEVRTFPIPDDCSPDIAGFGTRSRGTCRDSLADVEGPLMVVVPADGPIVAPIAISKYEITVAEYNDYCTHSGNCSALGIKDTNLPVTGVPLANVEGMIDWLSATFGSTYQLPNSAEWTYAATADGRPGRSVNCRFTQNNVLVKGLNLLAVSSGEANSWGLKNSLGNARELVRSGDQFITLGGGYTDRMDKCSVDALARDIILQNGRLDEVTGFRLLRKIGSL